jgi:HSP20 family protein
MTSIFDEFLPGFARGFDVPVANARPSVDVIEEDDKIVLRADMPGMEKDDIKVVVHDRLLTIEGKREEVNKVESPGYQRSERFMGTFARSFRLPAWADGAKLAAEYRNGVLAVTIPKTETARPKPVEIKIG